jgi:hypothetical protein
VVDWSLIVSIVGSILTLIFGGLAFYQSIERREQQRAIRVFSQGLYNNLQRMGAGSEALLRCDDFSEAKRTATGINEVSQAAQNWVISLGKEYAEFAPYYEAAWAAKEVPQRLRPFWRRWLSKS